MSIGDYLYSGNISCAEIRVGNAKGYMFVSEPLVNYIYILFFIVKTYFAFVQPFDGCFLRDLLNLSFDCLVSLTLVMRGRS